MSLKQRAHGSELYGYPIPRRPITFDLRQEPGAGKPHARICAGGEEQSSSLPRPYRTAASAAEPSTTLLVPRVEDVCASRSRRAVALIVEKDVLVEHILCHAASNAFFIRATAAELKERPVVCFLKLRLWDRQDVSLLQPIDILRGFACSAFGSTRVNTPSFISALILLWSTLFDSEKLRR